MVVLKNCEPVLSYMLADLSHMSLKESCFPDCWKVLSVAPEFKNVGEMCTAKNLVKSLKNLLIKGLLII